jgi:hypothetical protein
MTETEIDQVSRSWIGHLATNPALRQQLNSAMQTGASANAKVATLINTTVGAKANVTADDVSKIQTYVKSALPAAISDDHTDHIRLTRLGPGGPGGPGWPGGGPA